MESTKKPTWGDRVKWQEVCRDKKCVTTTRHSHTVRGKIVYMSEAGTAYIEEQGGGYSAIPVDQLEKEKP